MNAVAGWSDFLAASAATVGALVGLVFVSLSINLSRILELPGVASRAGETLIVLAGALAGALLALIPDMPPSRLGAILLIVAVPTWLIPIVIQGRTLRARAYQNGSLLAMRMLLHQSATLPGVLAGLSLGGLLPGGLGWFALGIIASILVALLNAWVLLVEILR